MTQRPFLLSIDLNGGFSMHKSRVKVTLNEDTSLAIRRLSKASGESMASVISSLFEPHVSELNDMANLLEHAGQIRNELPDKSRDFFRSVMSQIRSDTKPSKPSPSSTRKVSARATPKQRFQAESERLNALKSTKIENKCESSFVNELEPWELEQERLEREGLEVNHDD